MRSSSQATAFPTSSTSRSWRARELSGEPGIGYAWGLWMHVASFGYLGFAIMTAGTLRDAFEVAERFFELTMTVLPMRLQLESSAASIVLEERADCGTRNTRPGSSTWVCVGPGVSRRRASSSTHREFRNSSVTRT